MQMQREQISKNDIAIMKLTDEIKKGKSRGEDVRLFERSLQHYKDANEGRRKQLEALQGMTDEQFEESEEKQLKI